jgi:hypothetical protein
VDERHERVSTRLMAGTRRSSRKRGKSDQIDAVSVARASLAAGIETLPTAALAARSSICGCWSIIANVSSAPVTRARCDPETQSYVIRKKTAGKTQRDAIRCLKRHLARRIWHLLQPPAPTEISLNLLT